MDARTSDIGARIEQARARPVRCFGYIGDMPYMTAVILRAADIVE